MSGRKGLTVGLEAESLVHLYLYCYPMKPVRRFPPDFDLPDSRSIGDKGDETIFIRSPYLVGLVVAWSVYLILGITGRVLYGIKDLDRHSFWEDLIVDGMGVSRRGKEKEPDCGKQEEQVLSFHFVTSKVKVDVVAKKSASGSFLIGSLCFTERTG